MEQYLKIIILKSVVDIGDKMSTFIEVFLLTLGILFGILIVSIIGALAFVYFYPFLEKVWKERKNQ